MSETSWYVKWQGKVQGPVPWGTLQQLAQSGRLKPEMSLSRDQRSWTLASEIPGLFGTGPSSPQEDFLGVAEIPSAPAPRPPNRPPTRSVRRVTSPPPQPEDDDAQAGSFAPGDAGWRGKTKMAAGLLGIFLGGFGVHHFYLGSWKLGLVECLATVLGGSCFCVLGIFTLGLGWFIAPVPGALAGIFALIEGIILLSMTDADFDAKYNQRVPDGFEFVFQRPSP